MSRGIYEVKYVLLTVTRIVYDSDALRLDGYSSFPLKVHVVKHLVLHLTACKCTCLLYDPVGKCRLAMVYMGNYAKISYLGLIYMLHVYLSTSLSCI